MWPILAGTGPEKGPKSPTVNHRGNVRRKVRSKSVAKDGLIHLSPVDVGEIRSENPQRFQFDRSLLPILPG